MANINYIEKHLKTFTVRAHKHNYWEIIYVTEGNGQIETTDGKVFPYSKGDTICIPPNVIHTNISASGFKNLHLTIDGLQLKSDHILMIPPSVNSKELECLLNMSYKYFHLLPIEHELNFSLANAIVSLLTHLLKNHQAPSITQAIENEIIHNYTDMYFDLDRVYESIPYSKEYARKVFLKDYKISPAKFLLNKRIELAIQLLSERENNKYSIKDISESCGFPDQLYFSRVFKKEVGVSPKDYKVTVLNNNKIY